jgi:hypothetical protein
MHGREHYPPRLPGSEATFSMKCRLSICQRPLMRIKVKPLRTFRSVGDLIVHTVHRRASGLNSDMPLPSCQEVRDGDKNVTSSTPEILDDVVFGPLVSYSNLVYRVDVFDQLQVCAPEYFLFSFSSTVETANYSASR